MVVLAALAAQLDEMLYWVTETAAAEDERQRQRHIAVFQEARGAGAAADIELTRPPGGRGAFCHRGRMLSTPKLLAAKWLR
ncbi:MAG: hypothetical protein L0Z62_23205 [Gemmataceae bacterium]|nr:hypothetical protein [Gemmataceae bacterium]